MAPMGKENHGQHSNMGGNRDGAPRQSTDRLDTLQREQHQDITDKAGAQQQDKVNLLMTGFVSGHLLTASEIRSEKRT